MTSSLSAILDKALSGAQFKAPKPKTKHIERSDQMKKVRVKPTPEQREQIVLFIHTKAGEYAGKQQCLQAAFEHCGVNMSAKSSSTITRWFGYAKSKVYNPALRTPSPGSPAAVLQQAEAEPPKAGGKLGSTELIQQYPEIMKRLAEIGCSKAFEEHPEWEQLLFSHAKVRQSVYTAVNTLRKKMGIVKTGKPAKKGGAMAYTPQHYAIMTEILNTQTYRTAGGKRVAWEFVFGTHTDWAELFNWPKAKAAVVAFSTRVKNGAQPPAESSALVLHQTAPIDASPVNGHGVALLGREYTLLELERIIGEHREFLHAPKACPDCGYPLLMHTKAYNIARKHRRVESEF